MSRAGMWIGVKTNTLADDSAAHLAEIIIQGATMGVIAITRARNDLPDASPEAQDMAANLITVQQDAIERLKAPGQRTGKRKTENLNPKSKPVPAELMEPAFGFTGGEARRSPIRYSLGAPTVRGRF